LVLNASAFLCEEWTTADHLPTQEMSRWKVFPDRGRRWYFFVQNARFFRILLVVEDSTETT